MSLQPGDVLLNGQYRIVRQIGRGGFGFVYLAQHTLLHEEVAVKELIPALVGDEEMLKRFLAEARATMRLTHERIVRTHDVFSERGNYYIAMEYMAGGSLEARLAERGVLPVGEAVRIAADIAEGLAYAHDHKVVHCDLKPANILFTSDGRAKVADFGIAHIPEEMLTRTWRTPVGFVAGTLPYMAPEQLAGVRDEPRADLYALGAILYRMLTGRAYLEFEQRETPLAQSQNVQRIQSQAPAAPSSHNRRVLAWLDAVVLRALAKLPEQRYSSAGQMRQGLLQQSGAAAPIRPGETDTVVTARRAQPQSQPRPQPWLHPKWFWRTVWGTAIILVVIIAMLMFRGGDGGGRNPMTTITRPVIAWATTAAAPPASSQGLTEVAPTALSTTTPTPIPSATTPTATVPPVPPTSMAATTITLVPTRESPSPTSSPVTRLTANQPVNVRSGPGTNYPIIGQLAASQSHDIIGKNQRGDWYQFKLNGQFAWVSAELTTVRGDLATVQVAQNIPAAPMTRPPNTPMPTLRFDVMRSLRWADMNNTGTVWCYVLSSDASVMVAGTLRLTHDGVILREVTFGNSAEPLRLDIGIPGAEFLYNPDCKIEFATESGQYSAYLIEDGQQISDSFTFQIDEPYHTWIIQWKAKLVGD